MAFSVSFARSVARFEDCPADALPEIALAGRSNVGKSSLINALADRKQLARTSGTPGKTQILNYYQVSGQFYFVDMPGYGYARTAKTERIKWANLIETYLLNRTTLRAVGVLLDARHPLMASDREAMLWLREHAVPFFAVLTKSDQSKQNEMASLRATIQEEFGGDVTVIPTSSRIGRGIGTLREFIKTLAISSNE